MRQPLRRPPSRYPSEGSRGSTCVGAAAPVEVLYDRLCRDEYRDVFDALAARGRPADQRC
ncbi:hypothetical protein [Streptacidiphilus pinicola]|uniref:hypothetical protein n=1 Tax=Streptacidiphilus pinicola TaxID=2219663 RepID=UPI0010579149|nr:hypothetical protein [Streptacidiphilus pinicola]